MQSCSELQQQYCTQKSRARIRTRKVHVSRIRSEMQQTDRGKERERERERRDIDRVKAPFQVLHGECGWRRFYFFHAVIKDRSKHTTGAWKASPQSLPISHLNTHHTHIHTLSLSFSIHKQNKTTEHMTMLPDKLPIANWFPQWLNWKLSFGRWHSKPKAMKIKRQKTTRGRSTERENSVISCAFFVRLVLISVIHLLTVRTKWSPDWWELIKS